MSGAFVYTPPATATLLEGTTCGRAINALGHVVGYTTTVPQQSHVFLYTPTRGVVNLNMFLPVGSGWTLLTANGINDAGQITGTGRNQAVRRGHSSSRRLALLSSWWWRVSSAENANQRVGSLVSHHSLAI